MLVNESTRTYNLHINNVQLDDEAQFECQTSASFSSPNTGGGVLSNHNNHNHHHHHHSLSKMNPIDLNQIKQPIRAAANLHLISKLLLISFFTLFALRVSSLILN